MASSFSSSHPDSLFSFPCTWPTTAVPPEFCKADPWFERGERQRWRAEPWLISLRFSCEEQVTSIGTSAFDIPFLVSFIDAFDEMELNVFTAVMNSLGIFVFVLFSERLDVA